MRFLAVVVEGSVGMVVFPAILLATLVLFDGFFYAYDEVEGTFFVKVFIFGLAFAGKGILLRHLFFGDFIFHEWKVL